MKKSKRKAANEKKNNIPSISFDIPEDNDDDERGIPPPKEETIEISHWKMRHLRNRIVYLEQSLFALSSCLDDLEHTFFHDDEDIC